MAWVSPTGFVDTANVWGTEPFAYDGNLSTYAQEGYASGWGDFLELTIAALNCDKVRHNSQLTSALDAIDIDVYYDGAWQHVYEGAYAHFTWQEKSLGDTYAVTAARVRYHRVPEESVRARLYEFEFNEVVVAVGRSFGYIIG